MATLVLVSIALLQSMVASFSVHYSVFEEQNIGTRIGNVLKDSRIEKQFPGGNNCQLFDIGNVTKSFDIFLVNGTSCEMLVHGRIDRESLCGAERCVLALSVFVATQVWVSVTVEILDINDHAPRFEVPSISLAVPENTPIGRSFELPLAVDSDLGQNSVQSYVIQPLLAQFDLSFTAGTFLRLTVSADLDYEDPSTRSFSTKVTACDWGSPRLCGDLNLLIFVTDLNDNRPTFMVSNLTVDVMEDSSVGRLVTTTLAQDLDHGDNGHLSYFIAPTIANKQAADFFFVNISSGQLFLSKSIQDVDTPGFFRLTVTAKDRGQSPLSADCTVTIRIVDVNNHAPAFSVTPTLGVPLQISEGMPPGTTVGLLRVTDKDKGDNGLVHCELRKYKSLVSLEQWNMGSSGQMYKLLVNEPLDREETGTLNISISCTDRGVPARSTEMVLSILVIDVNEYDPILIAHPSVIVVPEDLRVNTSIARLIATDKDADAKLSIRLGHGNELFRVDSNGYVRLIKSFDRESRSQVTLSAIASDGGQPQGRTSTLLLTINISDVNDNEPQLLEPRTFQLLENLAVSPCNIGQLKAFDPDLAMNGTVRFSLLRATSTDNHYLNNTFYIDERNGTIFSLKPIDRESTPSIVLRVLLRDKGTPVLTREEVVHLIVVDENDNRPLWQFPSAENCHVNMSVLGENPRYEHRPVLITVVRVSDPDTHSNANITFKLLSASCNNVPVASFSLDPVTGHLVALGPILEGVYLIQMQASDNGQPPLLSETATLYLKVFSHKNNFFNSENDRLSLTLIVALGSVTCIICISLVVAIIVVRHHRYGATQFSSSCQNDQNSVVNESLAKWTEEQNQYLDSWGCQSQYYSYPMITPHYKLSSIGEPLLPPPGPNDVLSSMTNQPHMCSMMQLRRPTHQDLEVSSADSGRGASEEENFHSEGKTKDAGRSRGRAYATLPMPPTTCACLSSGVMCGSCMANLAANYQYGNFSSRQTFNIGDPLFQLSRNDSCHLQNNGNTIDTIVTAGAWGGPHEILSVKSQVPQSFSSDVSSFCNHTNV